MRDRNMTRTENSKSFINTRVAPAKTRQQINSLLRQKGAVAVRSTEGESPNRPGKDYYAIEFIHGEQRLAARVSVSFDKDSPSAERQAMRAMYWHLKSKFEAIEHGIEDFAAAFMPYLITDDGKTVAEHLKEFEDALPGGFTFGDGKLSQKQIDASTEADWRTA